MEKPNNKITISFKPNELDYLEKFKKKYTTPTSILKDFIKNDISQDKTKNTETTISLPNIPKNIVEF